jgi:hypothetical protein
LAELRVAWYLWCGQGGSYSLSVCICFSGVQYHLTSVFMCVGGYARCSSVRLAHALEWLEFLDPSLTCPLLRDAVLSVGPQDAEVRTADLAFVTEYCRSISSAHTSAFPTLTPNCDVCGVRALRICCVPELLLVVLFAAVLYVCHIGRLNINVCLAGTGDCSWRRCD